MNCPINFKLYGLDDNGVERQLSLSANDNGFNFNLLTNSPNFNQSANITFSLKDGCTFLRAYNNNYGGGSPYQERDFYKPFFKQNLTICQENLVRAFAVTSGYVQFWYTNEYEGHPSCLNYYKDFHKSLSDRILFDWTGTLDVQPQMYFLPIELKERHTCMMERSVALDELYRMRVLQRYECSSSEIKFSNYYVPFVIPDTERLAERFQCHDTLVLWKTIVAGINKEIKRLVRNNS